MLKLIKTGSDENNRSCLFCVYFDTEKIQDEKTFCQKKKKYIGNDKGCRKFSLDITKITARRRRSPAPVNPDDFSID